MILFAVAMAAPCELDNPPDAPFQVQAPPDAKHVAVVPLLRLKPDNGEATVAMAKVFAEHGQHVGILVRPEGVDAIAGPLEQLVDAGHQPVVTLKDIEIGVDLVKDPAKLRRFMKPLTQITGKLKAVEAPLGDNDKESVLHRTGLRTVFVSNGVATGAPRRQARFEGQTAVGVVIPDGPYSGPCGRSPEVDGLRPAGADRTTQAVYGARSSEAGFVRMVVSADAHSAPVLDRWLTEVIEPAAIPVMSPAQARDHALQGLRNGLDEDPTRSAGGRLIRVDEVREVARSIVDLNEIPRRLPKDLTPTEAFIAFVLVSAGEIEGDVVRLPSIQGPATLNDHLPEPVNIDPEAARTLAKALLKRLPDRIPSALPVDGHVLNAPALFSLYASMARGDDPPTARPMAVREPNAPGLGWGDATTP